MDSIRDSVENTGTATSTHEVIALSLQMLDKGVVNRLHTVDSLSCNIQNWRKNTSGISALTESRSGYHLPDSFNVLSDGSIFLAYDSGIDDPSCILIFPSESGLNNIMNSTS